MPAFYDFLYLLFLSALPAQQPARSCVGALLCASVLVAEGPSCLQLHVLSVSLSRPQTRVPPGLPTTLSESLPPPPHLLGIVQGLHTSPSWSVGPSTQVIT